MAIKTYSGTGVEAGVPNTKLRAEQMKSEDSFTSLAVDLEALRGQIKGIIGAADYKEEITGEYAKVQIVDLAAHLDASGGASLSVKQAANVVGAFSVNTDKLTVAAATGNTAIKGTLDVDGQATLASANVEDLTDGRIVVAGALGELGDFSGLTFAGGELTAASATVSDLTATRVVYAGTSGALVDSAEMTFGATGLTLAKDLSARSGSFSGDLTITGDLFVQGNTVTVDVGTLTIEDKNIVIAKDAVGATLDGAGIFLGSEGGESISWNHADTKWVSSDKFAADVLQALDLTDAIVWADASGNLTEITAANLGAAVNAELAGTANQISISAPAAITGISTLSLPQSIDLNADVEFDSLKLGDNVADAGKALKIGAAGEVSSAAWNEFFVVQANVGLSITQEGFKVALSQSQDLRSSASPEFAALNLAAYGDLAASGSDFKVSATAALFLGDSYQAGSSFSTALKLAGSSDEWSKIESAYGGEKTLLGMLAAAAPSTNQRMVKVGTAASAGPDFFIGAGDASGAFPTGAVKYQGGLSDVYVNGQKQVEGSTADFEFQDAAGADKVKVAFKYSLQIGDVVEVIRYPAAAK